jgi:hypothetical protein
MKFLIKTLRNFFRAPINYIIRRNKFAKRDYSMPKH